MKHCTLPTILAVKTTIYFTYRAVQPCRPKTAKTLRLVKCVLELHIFLNIFLRLPKEHL